jgi:hypothetical protein
MNNLLVYGLGMLVVFATSWMYHGTGDPYWRRVDISSNLLMIGIYGIMLVTSSQYKPLIMLIIAGISYGLKLTHSLFVHLPIALGFSMIK